MTARAFAFQPDYSLISVSDGKLLASAYVSCPASWAWAQRRISEIFEVDEEDVGYREAGEGEPADIITVGGADVAYLVPHCLRERVAAHFTKRAA